MCENSTKGPYKPRDLFGVQLEVTSLLLEAELIKLSTLQGELESTQNFIIENCKDTEQRQEIENQQLELILAISRIQAQADQLEREYRVHALGALKSVPLRGSGKSNRSQPAIGLKYLPKYRTLQCVQVIRNMRLVKNLVKPLREGWRESGWFDYHEVLRVTLLVRALAGWDELLNRSSALEAVRTYMLLHYAYSAGVILLTILLWMGTTAQLAGKRSELIVTLWIWVNAGIFVVELVMELFLCAVAVFFERNEEDAPYYVSLEIFASVLAIVYRTGTILIVGRYRREVHQQGDAQWID